MAPEQVRNRIAAAALCLLALISCSRPEGFLQFIDAEDGRSRYDFDVPLMSPDVEYDSFIALRLDSAETDSDSIPAKIAIVSPSGQMAVETVAFSLHGVRFSGNAVEYPYRSGIKVAQDTGLWHLSIILQDSSLASNVLGAGLKFTVNHGRQ